MAFSHFLVQSKSHGRVGCHGSVIPLQGGAGKNLCVIIVGMHPHVLTQDTLHQHTPSHQHAHPAPFTFPPMPITHTFQPHTLFTLTAQLDTRALSLIPPTHKHTPSELTSSTHSLSHHPTHSQAHFCICTHSHNMVHTYIHPHSQ